MVQMGRWETMRERIKVNLVSKILKQRTGAVATANYEELQQSFDQDWGLVTKQWRSVSLYDTILHHVLVASSRILSALHYVRGHYVLQKCF